MLEQIDTAIGSGAKVLHGGKRFDRRGFFLEPTILTEVQPDNPAYRQEFFAPVAEGLPGEERRRRRWTSPTLRPSAWVPPVITRDVERGKRVVRQIDSSMVFING